MAKENFLQQVEGTSLSIGHIQSSTNIEKNKNADVIFIESGKSDLLLETMNALTDIEERIILIKNFEVFEDHVVESCLSYKMLILSGNIDNSSVKEKVASIHYESIIAFSQPQYALPIAYKQQERYSGYIKKSSIHGTIKLETTL
jgi:hypothetical protein